MNGLIISVSGGCLPLIVYEVMRLCRVNMEIAILTNGFSCLRTFSVYNIAD